MQIQQHLETVSFSPMQLLDHHQFDGHLGKKMIVIKYH